jgi:phosphate transport system permease protein
MPRWGRYRKEFLGRAVVTFFGISIIILTLAIASFLLYKGTALFTLQGHSVAEFLFKTEYRPKAVGTGGSVGAGVFIYGSVLISALAVLIATPFSVAAAVFMTEISPGIGRSLLQPAIAIFTGIPSVVYGWIGLTVLVPFIAKQFGRPHGFSVLAGALVLALMIFPTVTSVSADALRNAPSEFREASYGLGSTRWQSIRRVVVPAAMPGILTGVVLGMARAFGETLAVAMVIGRMPRIPSGILSPANSLTAQIAVDMGNTAQGSEWNNTLWSMALLLLVISFLSITLIRILGRFGERRA